MNTAVMGVANQEAVRQVSAKANEPDWLLRKRLEALENFNRLEMPDLRYGSNVRLNIGDLNLSEVFDRADKGEGGISIKRDGPEAAMIMELAAAIKQEDNAKKHFGTITRSENKFDALTAAIWRNGTFIYIPKGVELKQPIRLSSVINGNGFERVLIIAAPGSKAVVVEDISSESEAGYRGSLVEIFADNDSKIKFVSVQKLGKGFYDIGSKKAVVMNNARVDWVFAAVGGKITKLEVSTLLDGQGGLTENLGMFMGNASQQFDIFTAAIHNAPNTNSDLLTKGSLREQSKSIYRGLVNIKQHAKGCDGFQRADTLLLSPYAQADAIPFLEIDNNDVKCTHAASIGQVDKEKIFYMQSRGLSYEEAERQIVQGFFEAVMEKIGSEEIIEALREIIAEKA